MVEYGVDPGTSVVKRKDGSKEFYKDNKLVKEESAEGKTVIRVKVGTPKGSKSKKGGSSGSRSKESEVFKVQKAKTASQKMEEKIERALQKEAQAKEKERVRKTLTVSDVERFKAYEEFKRQERQLKSIQREQKKIFKKPEEKVFKRIVGKEFKKEVKTRQKDKFFKDLIQDISNKDKFAPVKKSAQESKEVFIQLEDIKQFSKKLPKDLSTNKEVSFFEKSLIEKAQTPEDYLLKLLKPSKTEIATRKVKDFSGFGDFVFDLRKNLASSFQTSTKIRRGVGEFGARVVTDPFVGASILAERTGAKRRGDKTFIYPEDPFTLFTKRPNQEVKQRKIKVEGFDVFFEPEVIELAITPIAEVGGEFAVKGLSKAAKKITPFVDDLSKATSRRFDDIVLESRRIKRKLPKNVLDQPFDEDLLFDYTPPKIKKSKIKTAPFVDDLQGSSRGFELFVDDVRVKGKIGELDETVEIIKYDFDPKLVEPVLDKDFGTTKEFQFRLLPKEQTPKPKVDIEIKQKVTKKEKPLFDFIDEKIEKSPTKSLSEFEKGTKDIEFLSIEDSKFKKFLELDKKIPKEKPEIFDLRQTNLFENFEPPKEIRLRPEVAGMNIDDFFITKKRKVSPTEEIISLEGRKSKFFPGKKGQQSILTFKDEGKSFLDELNTKRKIIFETKDKFTPLDSIPSIKTKPSGLIKTIPISDILSTPKSRIDFGIDRISSKRQSFNIVPDLDIRTNVDNLFDISQSKVNSFSFDSAQRQDFTQDSITKTAPFSFDTRKDFDTRQEEPVGDFDFKVRKPKIKIDLFQKAKGKVPGYYAEVKEKGKFIRINKKPLSLKNTKSAMSRAIDNTPSRTGRVVFSNQYVKKQKKKDSYFEKNKNELRRNKSGLFIEKSKFAIDTKGEKRGITVKGWLSKKNKAIKKRWGL